MIEVPGQPQADPEIYFVNYQYGKNSTLLLEADFETALSSAAVGEAEIGGATGFGEVGGLYGTRNFCRTRG